MTTIILPATKENSKELNARRRHVSLSFASVSELPYRVEKKNTGQHLGAFATAEAVATFLLGCSVEDLARKPVRKRYSR